MKKYRRRRSLILLKPVSEDYEYKPLQNTRKLDPWFLRLIVFFILIGHAFLVLGFFLLMLAKTGVISFLHFWHEKVMLRWHALCNRFQSFINSVRVFCYSLM